MLVILTGPTKPSESRQLKERISTLRSRGVDIIIIGVGDVDVVELQKVTSDENTVEDKVLLSKSFHGVLQYSRDIADFACGEGIIDCYPQL